MGTRSIAILFAFFLTRHTVSQAQTIIDSIKVCGYPVKQGVVYQHELSMSGVCGLGRDEQGVSILTNSDSVFHIGIGEGKVVAVHYYGDGIAIVIKAENNEFISYANLQSADLCKGDSVQKGTFLGLAGDSYDDDAKYAKQVDLLIMKKAKLFGFKKAVEYIRCAISCEQSKDYTL